MVSAPQASPTPRPQLKAPVSILVPSGDEDHDGDEGHGGKIYVANVNAGTVSVIDVKWKRVTVEISVGAQPSALALARGGKLLLVANYGSASVSVIDIKTLKVTATLKAGQQPIDIAVAEDKAYVLNQGSNNVTVLDVKKMISGKSIRVGTQPSRIRMGSGSRNAYVSDTNDDSISVIDTHIDEVIATINE